MSRRLRRRGVGLALLLLSSTPVWAMKVYAERDRGVDFASYRSFVWEPQPERPPDHPLAPGSPLGARIIRAVEKELAEKGIRAAGPGERADFRIAYGAMLEDELDAESVYVQLGEGVAWVDTAGVPARSYSRGTLILHLLAPEGGGIVWRGWAVDVAKTPQKLADKVETAVRRILAQFPP